MYFSSSPEATSTPAGTLHGGAGRAQENDCSPLSTHSTIQLTFESPSDEEPRLSPSNLSRTSMDGSQSVKRKGTRVDVPIATAPLTKKARIVRGMSSDKTAGIRDAMSGLETEDGQANLSKKDRCAARTAESRKTDSKRGLRIFDVGKGKAIEQTEWDKPPKRGRPKVLMSKRTSISRPGSRLFGREPKAGNKKFSKLDRDDMDVDELAMDDPAHRKEGS